VVIKMSKKCNALLYLYEHLISGNVAKKKELCEKFDVSEKTFYRYIKDLNVYFLNEDKDKYEYKDNPVEYNEKKDGYVFKTKHNRKIKKEDALVISKVLLESRAFTEEEIDNLIEKLLINCIPEDKKYIEAIVRNEKFHYKKLEHNDNLIDKIWDLSYAIKKERLVEIEYLKVGKNGKLEDVLSKRILEPQGILFSEYYFYLIAFIKGKGYEYPAIYRLDRIKKYEILQEKFRVSYKDRFEEGEFRNLIQFMQTGKLQTIKFKFKGASIEAIKDRLPTADIVEINEGEYIVEAKMFGKGIKMWILSQGDYIEVLEPKEFRDEIRDTISNMLNKYSKSSLD
jgi:predicted DNA-binding transcriptional regulator YafY